MKKMKPPFPSPTPTWHNDTYQAIDRAKPGLSHMGETIIITGAGSGIGRETALAFAASRAEHLILIGRTESTLLETKKLVPEGTQVSVYPCDVVDAAAMRKIAAQVGTWNVFVHNAGYLHAPGNIADADVEDLWRSYEVNVKSLLIVAKEFLPSANPAYASLLAVSAGGIILPTPLISPVSGYISSKLAQIKTVESLATQNPNVNFVAVHPGCVESDIFYKSGASPELLPMDTVKLPADFMTWASKPEANFLNGRFVFANWDVDELKEMKAEIQEKNMFVPSWAGWPYAHSG